MKTFAKNTAATFAGQVITLIIGIGISVVIARLLGPENKGLYSLAILLPTFIVIITNLGINPATVYHTAKADYNRKQIFGNNIWLSLAIGAISSIIGLFVIYFFGESLLPGLPMPIALLALFIVPLQLLAGNLKAILLGMQRITPLNIISVVQAFLNLILIVIALVGLHSGVPGVIIVSILTSITTNIIVFLLVYKTLKGISFQINFSYIRRTLTYGIQAQAGNILGFLNYRADFFLVNLFLNPTAVGFYSIAVGISEKLWLASKATSMVLLPKIAAEKNEQVRKELTPIVSRTVLLITIIGASVLFFITKPLIILLYSTTFSSAVLPLQILLPGIVAHSASRILANDIAARGKPLLNSFLSSLALVANIVLNILLIPKFGIEGAAWATTISYSAMYVGRVWLYSRISNNPIIKIVIPQQSDLVLYQRFGSLSIRWLRKRLGT